MEHDITGNRDASYSNWHRATLPKKHTLLDDDLHDLNNSFLYTMYFGWDLESDLIPKVKFETKGIIRDANGYYILPDLLRHKTQIKAIRGDAKGHNIPAFLIFYYITTSLKFFVIVPLNKLARTYFTKYNYQESFYIANEKEYIALLKQITGMTFDNTGEKTNLKELKFKDTLFKNSLQELNLFK
jgi:hypothetical protein